MKNPVNILKFLETSADPRSTVIVGLGNLDRADDGAGIVLAEQLKVHYSDQVFSEKEQSVESIVLYLLERNDAETFLFIDSADFGGRPGEVKIFQVEDAKRFVPAFSTHKVPIALLMELLAQRGKKPILLGIQPESLEFLGKMSISVEKRLVLLEKLLKRFLRIKSSGYLCSGHFYF